MTTHHGGTGQPSELDPNAQAQDIDIPNDYLEDIDNFDNVGHEHYMQLKELTNELDQLQHKVEVTENQPTEAISHLEHELHRLSLALCPSAPSEPPVGLHLIYITININMVKKCVSLQKTQM